MLYIIVMKILIIYTYPHHNSLNGAIFDAVIQNLNNEHDVKIIDLYQEHFNPVLNFDKNNKRRDLFLSTETKKYREAISWSNHLIFIFPIWWSSMPAILKGFIDKVFAQNFAYSYDSNKIIPHKLLHGKTASIIVTHDTPQFIAKYIQKDYGKILKKQILENMCGIRVNALISFPNVRKSSLKRRVNFLNKIKVYAKKL